MATRPAGVRAIVIHSTGEKTMFTANARPAAAVSSTAQRNFDQRLQEGSGFWYWLEGAFIRGAGHMFDGARWCIRQQQNGRAARHF